MYETDGCRLSRRNQRTLVVEADSESDKGISSDRRRIFVVPDSSVVSFNLQPKEGAYRITVRVRDWSLITGRGGGGGLQNGRGGGT